MQLQRIVSLANKNSKLQFLAMERSLRATGCDLPVWVIPYDDNIFDLPNNCIWWEIPEITNWIDLNKLWPAFKKIQCLTIEEYQFVDSDVIFLKNPVRVLEPLCGFVTSCTHWKNSNHTVTDETIIYFKKKSSNWQKMVFNSGQWACDQILYEIGELKDFCESNFEETLFKKNFTYKDQPGINILVNYKHVPITNLTLPPFDMESTWAGDYLEYENFQRFEVTDKPYIIHWAGTLINDKKNIHQYLFKHLSEQEGQIILNNYNSKNKVSKLQMVIKKAKAIYSVLKN